MNDCSDVLRAAVTVRSDCAELLGEAKRQRTAGGGDVDGVEDAAVIPTDTPADLPFKVAVTVALPRESGVTRPAADTVRHWPLELDQTTDAVMSEYCHR